MSKAPHKMAPNLLIVIICFVGAFTTTCYGQLAVRIGIHTPPCFEVSHSPPDTFEICELHTLNMTCNVTNAGDYPDGQLAYRWSRNTDDWTIETGNMHFQVFSDDSAEYQCQASLLETLLNGEAIQKIAVLYFPRWQDGELQKFAGSEGGVVTLECHVHSYPAAQLYWSFRGSNISTSRRTDSSTYLDVRINSESDYGDYVCHASNSMGSATYNINLGPPGRPDHPQDCVASNVTVYTATLECLPGYAGGEALQFEVDKQSPHDAREKAESSYEIHSDDHVTVFVQRLDSNTNWTLSVYQSNRHGRSHESIAVLIRTLYGPPLDDGKPGDFPVVAVAAGAAAGGILIMVLIAVVACMVLRKKSTDKNKQSDDRNYVMDEGEEGGGMSRQRGSGSSRNQLTGLHNPNYSGSVEQVNRSLPADYTGAPLRVVGLANIGGRDNNAYNQDSVQESSFTHEPYKQPYNQKVSPNGRQMSPPGGIASGEQLQRANRMMETQPGLAGAGALTLGLTGGLGSPPYSGYNQERTVSKPSANQGSRQQYNAQSHQPLRNYQHSSPEYQQRTVSKPSANHGNRNQCNTQSHQPQRNYQHNSPEYQQAPCHPQQRNPIQSPDRFPNQGHDHSQIYGSQQGSPNAPSFQQAGPWEFPRNKLYIRYKLGEGRVGEVWRATAEGLAGSPPGGGTVVAVKMLRDNYTDDEQTALMRQLDLMKALKPHPNITALLGCCVQPHLPPCILMQFSCHGGLLGVLRAERGDGSGEPRLGLSLQQSTRLALNIATAMDYIASHQLLHRDLAARSVLVSVAAAPSLSPLPGAHPSGNDVVARLDGGDFAPSAELAESRLADSRSGRPLPVRWMAPELLTTGEYTSAADVWAFGVLLWEMATLGSTPYPDLNGAEVVELIQKGHRLERPKHCSMAFYSLMFECWEEDPHHRPTFSQLSARLQPLANDRNSAVIRLDQLGDNVSAILAPQPGEIC